MAKQHAVPQPGAPYREQTATSTAPAVFSLLQAVAIQLKDNWELASVKARFAKFGPQPGWTLTAGMEPSEAEQSLNRLGTRRNLAREKVRFRLMR